MNTKRPADTLFAEPQPYLVDFAFDARVAEVFPDMIRRSVPGYDHVIAMLGTFAAHYAQPASHIYDLGCSLGAASLAMLRHVPYADCHLFAIDNAAAMVERCRDNLAQPWVQQAVTVECADIRDVPIHNACLVVMNFTLQFVPPADRDALIRRLFTGLNPGGVLIVSEKVVFPDDWLQQTMTELHLAFKRANGYSELEISQKRQAIENVLIPESLPAHEQRLRQAGFDQVACWFQSLNFASLMAVKPQ